MKLPIPHIKKIDLFIVKTFVGNLMATFLICLFIFIMQLLWMWVDDFVEKGLDFSILARFFAFGSITLVSQSLPLAILLAALMTFGNFGEKLGLLAMKSAGIPLLRIMSPLARPELVLKTILSLLPIHVIPATLKYQKKLCLTLRQIRRKISPSR